MEKKNERSGWAAKDEVVKTLHAKFAQTKTAVLVEFNKLDVETVTKLRKKFREGGVDYRVLKNSLAMRAAKGTPLELISADFRGTVALAISATDVIAPAKILTDFVKADMETLKVRGAVVDGKKVDAAGVKALAKMPGLPELRARILGCITQPATKVVRTIAAPGGQLARVLAARKEALEKGGQAA